MSLWLSWNSLCKPGWPWNQRDPKVCTTTAQLALLYSYCLSIEILFFPDSNYWKRCIHTQNNEADSVPATSWALCLSCRWTGVPWTLLSHHTMPCCCPWWSETLTRAPTTPDLRWHCPPLRICPWTFPFSLPQSVPGLIIRSHRFS